MLSSKKPSEPPRDPRDDEAPAAEHDEAPVAEHAPISPSDRAEAVPSEDLPAPPCESADAVDEQPTEAVDRGDEQEIEAAGEQQDPSPRDDAATVDAATVVERNLRTVRFSESPREREWAWADLWIRYSGPLYRFARVRLNGNRELAESVVNETFAVTWQAIESGRYHSASEGQFTRWLFTCCTNAIRQALREIIRDRKTFEPASVEETYRGVLARLMSERKPLPPHLATPDHGTDAANMIVEIERAKRALKYLPERQRQCLLMSARGYRGLEIAQRLGISEGAVNAHISAGRKRLRELLPRVPGDDTDP